MDNHKQIAIYKRVIQMTEQQNGCWYVTVPAYGMVTATTLNTTPARTPEQEIHNEDRTVLDTDSTGRNQNTTDNVLYAE